jgi:hypothetical protein
MAFSKLNSSIVSCLLAVLSFLPSSASAGGWTTGGGELFGDKQNPWFLQNVKSVRYCIEINETAMGVSRQQVIPLVKNAFEYWKFQFSLPAAATSRVKLATQEFVFEERCSSKSDIRFQFGVLTPLQLRKLQEPSRYLGIAVRTDYDRRTLKGRGFVYFSPERGPQAMRANSGPWSITDGLALYPILLHEVGHIMGLSHSSTYLMREHFAEQLLALLPKEKTHAKAMIQKLFIEQIPDFIQFNETNPMAKRFCVRMFGEPGTSIQPNLFNRFFEITPRFGHCSYATIGADGELQVVQAGPTGSETIMGRATLKKLTASAKKQTVARVYLPREQTVFPIEDVPKVIDAAYAETSSYWSGRYISVDGKTERSIGVEVEPWGVPRISGILNEKLIMNIDAEEMN